MPSVRRSRIAPLALLLALLLASCSGTPTAPPDDCSGSVTIYANADFYRERPEAEAVFRGRLTKNCPAPTPGGRDHCYFLGDLPLYTSGKATEPALEPFVGADVAVRGKRVLILTQSEIWPASICRR